MTVADLKEILKTYNDNAKVVVVDWSNGREFEPSVGGDDEDEYTEYCRIGI
jgi:hypothetical protein